MRGGEAGQYSPGVSAAQRRLYRIRLPFIPFSILSFYNSVIGIQRNASHHWWEGWALTAQLRTVDSSRVAGAAHFFKFPAPDKFRLLPPTHSHSHTHTHS